MRTLSLLLLLLLASTVLHGCKKKEDAPTPVQKFVEFRPAPTASVSGRISVEGGGPLHGVMVFAEGTSNLGLTDSAGRYVVSGLEEGEYQFHAMRSDLAMTNVGVATVTAADIQAKQPYMDLGDVTVKTIAATETAALSATLGSLKGKVVSQDGAGIPGAIIQLDQTDFRTVSTANGEFMLSNIPVGNYTAFVSHASYYYSNARVEVKAGAVTDAGQISLQTQEFAGVNGGGRRLTGRVQMFDAEESPLAEFDQVFVSLQGTSYIARPGPGGEFEINGIQPGTYVVTATANGFVIDQNTDIDLTELMTIDVTVVMHQSGDELAQGFGTVEGRVVLEDPPGSSAGVTVSLTGTSSIAITDADGYFILQNVPIGIYDLIAVLEGYESGFVEGIEVVDGDQLDIGDLELAIKRTVPEVIATEPFNEAVDVTIDDPTLVVIRFNVEMNPDSLRKAISVSPAVDFEIATAGQHPLAAEDQVVLVLAGYTKDGNPVKFGTRYTVTVGKAAESAEGVPMKESYALRFTTGEAKIVATFPADGQKDVYIYPSVPVRLYFNVGINTDQFTSDDIRVRPKLNTVPTFNVVRNHKTGWSEMTISGVFEYGTEYTITINRGIRTLTGDKIANLPYKFKFRMGTVSEGGTSGSTQDADAERERQERRRK